MVEVSYCAACKYYIGLADDKVTRYCKAFPEGRSDFEPTKGCECANGFCFVPKDEYKELFKNEE